MIYDRIIELICDAFQIKPDELNENTTFVEDMGIDSLDMVELMVSLEDEFGLHEIPEEDLMEMKTIGDLVEYVRTHTEE